MKAALLGVVLGGSLLVALALGGDSGLVLTRNEIVPEYSVSVGAICEDEQLYWGAAGSLGPMFTYRPPEPFCPFQSERDAKVRVQWKGQPEVRIVIVSDNGQVVTNGAYTKTRTKGFWTTTACWQEHPLTGYSVEISNAGTRDATNVIVTGTDNHTFSHLCP